MSRQEVPSPCTGHCRLDADRARCTGCARTPDEIRRWHRGSPAEREAILAAIREREGYGGIPELEPAPSPGTVPILTGPVPLRVG